MPHPETFFRLPIALTVAGLRFRKELWLVRPLSCRLT